MMLTKAHTAQRAGMYSFLSRLWQQEADAPLLESLKALSLPPAGNETLTAGYALLRGYLDACGDTAVEDLAVDYAVAFLAAGSNDGSAAIPCESVYTSPNRLVMQEPWEDMCALYAGRGLGKNAALAGLPEDHLALELAYMGILAETADGREQAAFLDGHLLNWLPAFVPDVDRYARTGFYKAIARITLGFLQMERELTAALSDGTLRAAPSYSVRADRMKNVFARLSERYRIYAPVCFPGRGPEGGDLIRYGEVTELSQIVTRERSHFSPKEVFYPISETMFYFREDACTQKDPQEEKELILFARPCDINAIRRLDTVFLHNGQPDLFYARLREKLHIFLLECRESYDNCFCVSMGANRTEDYSVAVRVEDICALVEVKDETFLPYFADEVPADFAPEFVTSNPRAARLPVIRDRQQLGAVCSSAYWNKFDETCIGCGGCNTVCPTCSCFDTVDVIYDETSRDGERRRVWSSCMLADFTKTAGGGMARKTPGANMRFKVLHKVYDYHSRFGGDGQMCVGCGRCIDRCPREIDYLDAVNGLTELLERGEI